MSGTFDCPACGAPLYAEDDVEATIRCSYCQRSVIIPQEIRRVQPVNNPGVFSLDADPGSLVGQAAALKDVIELVRAGQKMEAIKRYHYLTGSGLAEAKNIIEKLERGESVALTGMYIDSGVASRGVDQTEVMERITALLAARNKIEAIKVYRETFGLGLKESKDAVEAIDAGMRAAGVTVVSASPGMTVSVERREAAPKTSSSGAWLVTLFSIGVPLCIVAFVFLIIGVTDGPLMGLWSRLNPVSFAAETLVFGGEGTGAGLFTDARAIAVDSNSGNIYVAEYSGGRVQVFDSRGKFQTQWSVGSSKTYIPAMAADRSGRVYVVGDGKIYIVDGSTGNLQGTLELADSFSYLDGLAVTASGELIVCDGDNIAWLNRQGEAIKTVERALSAVSDSSDLSYLAVDGTGTIYAMGTFSDVVFKFDPEGRYINRFGSDGDEAGQFRAPGPLAVDNQSRVYVSDMKGIQVFDKDGRYLELIPVKGYAFGLAFNDQNELFVVSNAEQVRKFVIKK